MMHMVELNYPNYESAWRQVPPSKAGKDKDHFFDDFVLRRKSVPLILDSNPSGALVSLDERDLGKTPRFIKSVPLGQHTAVFRFTGYATTRVPIDLSRQEYKIIKPTLESIMGAVVIMTKPGGAKVTVDGEPKGVSDSQTGRLRLTDVVEGRHVVVAEKEGFEEMKHSFLLKRNENMTVTMPELLSKPGSLTVTSEPPAANVYRGRFLAGRTPAELKRLPSGQIVLRIEKEGFEPQTKPVRVLPGINKVVHFDLVSNFGSVTLSTSPPGCNIIVDGSLKGESKSGAAPGISKPFEITQLTGGLHTIIVEKAGYERVTKQVLVQKGKNTALKPVTLNKLWLPTHRLLLKGATKASLVKIIRRTKTGYVYELKEGDSTIRDVIRSEDIEKLQKID
jgi:hypothetical protein